MSRSTPALSLIISTYEWPEALDLALRALAEQVDASVEVIVADDGSGEGTAKVVAAWQNALSARLAHVWQPNEGWRKARVLNLGALEARGDYLVFMDGDMIARQPLLAAVRRAAAVPGWFLATNRINLSREFSDRVLEERLRIWRWSAATWVLRARRELREPGTLLPLRDRRRPWRPGLPDFTPSDNAHGFFLGVSRADYERVNGYDLRFVGPNNEDDDLALRLRRLGLRCGWPGPGATMFHLWHPRGLGVKPNEPLFFETRASDRVQAVAGLHELVSEHPRHRSGARESATPHA